MSANQSCDITRIQDEDVLRKMWQDTEDFGRKKEIRSHMYKIREARLKEFYSSGDTNKEIHRGSVLKDLKQEATHHADSLVDQSFLSLKSKEIRDSESPTRDISSYKVGDKSGLDKTWSVKEKSERSDDGKCHTTSRLAVTSGSDKIEGGVSKYAAKHEQVASVYQDGDDKNFVREKGASSQSVIKQEASGGDENSKFYSSSTSSKSSSKFVSEQKSSSEDVIRQNTSSPQITYKTQTETVPVDYKQYPNYVEGKTKVFRETKTLPDGSTVTTTRYETVGGKTTEKTTSQGFTSTSSQRSSKETKSSNTVRREEHSDSRHSSDIKSLQDTKQVSSIKSDQDQYNLVNDEIHLANKYHTKNISKQQDLKENTDRSTIRHENIHELDKNIIRECKDIKDNTSKSTTKHENISQFDKNISRDHKDVTETIDRSTSKQEHTSKFDKKSASTQQKQSNIAVSEDKIQDIQIKTVVQPIVEVKKIISSNDLLNKKDVINHFIETEKHHIESTQKLEGPHKEVFRPKGKTPEYEQPKERYVEPETPRKQQPSKEKTPDYVQPERRQPIQPPKSEMDTKSTPTTGQYDTTYRTDYTNKRISVDISPTHDAFARSLRSVTPERERYNKCTSPVRSSPTRNTTTPTRHVERYYPNSRSSSPRKSASPDKFSSTETITKVVRHPSPKRTYSTETITKTQKHIERSDVDSGTITRRNKLKNVDRHKSPSPSSTYNKLTTTTRTDAITTTKFDNKEASTTRPTNLTITKTYKPKKVTERSPTSPIKDFNRRTTLNEPRRSSLKSPIQSPTKSPQKEFKPFTPQSRKEKPVLRRRDTYEERCREILGISEKKDEKITTTRQSKSTSPKRVVYETQPKSQPSNKSDLKEYPAQRRKSPEKQNIDKVFQKTKSREPSFEKTTNVSIDKSISSSISLEALSKVTDVKVSTTNVKEFSPERKIDSPDYSVNRDFKDVSPIRKAGSPDRKTEYTTVNIEDSFTKEYKYTSLDDLTNKSTHSRDTTPVRDSIKKQQFQPQGAYKNEDFPEYVKKPVKPVEPEDEIIARSIRYLEGERIPIDEPMITKKFIEKLGSDDEEDDFKPKPTKTGPIQKSKVDKVTSNLIINVKDNKFSTPSSKEKPQKPIKENIIKEYDSKRTKTHQTITNKQNVNKIESKFTPNCVTIKKHTIISPKDVENVNKKPKPATKIIETNEKINKQTTITTIKNKKSSDNLRNITETNGTYDKNTQPRGRKCCDHSKDTERRPTTNGITNITIKTSKKHPETQPHIKVTPVKLEKSKNIETTTITKKVTKKLEEPEILKKPQTNHKGTERPYKKLSNDNKKPSKTCISTKSIIISDAIADQREIIVDLKRSQSSREESPDNVWPITTEEDSGIPRYPDQIVEPEEPERRRKPTKISDIPLTESEDVTEFTRITEMVDTKITDIDRVAETDDCLLTVNEKVSKFTHSADNLIKKNQPSLGPAPKVERPTLIIDESLESDECLLSVSDKVNKFKTTADRLSISELPERPKSPRCRNVDDERVTITVDLTDSENTDAIIDKYFEIEDKQITESFIDDAKRDIVNVKEEKFISKIHDENDYVSSKKPEKLFETPKDVKKETPLVSIEKFVPTRDAENDFTPKKFPESSFETPKGVRPVPKTDKTTPGSLKDVRKETLMEKHEKCVPTRDVDNDFTPRKFPESSFETPKGVRPVPKVEKTTSGPLKDVHDTPKSGKRPTPEGKVILSDVGRLRSTESIKKARALFENIDSSKPKPKDILSRPSVFGSRKSPPKDVKFHDLHIRKNTISDKHLTTKEENKLFNEEKIIAKQTTDDENIPGYMKKLDRSLREKSPHKENVQELEEISKNHSYTIDEKHTKFGVVLKKTNSDKILTRKSSSTVLVEIDGIEEEMEIEDIFNIEILEKLLETVIGYEIRKRIRTQIRVVKKIEEERRTQVTHVIKAKTPERIYSSNITKHPKKQPEEISTCSKAYKSNTTVTTETRPSTLRQSPSRTPDYSKKSPSPSRQSPEKDQAPQKPQTNTYRRSPERKVETKLFKAELKPTKPAKKEFDDKKPEWVTKTTLKKVSERKPPTVIKTSSRTVTSKTEVHRSSPSREEKVTDLITSSYGVGPTDENGTPLFGLRALRAQNNKKENVKGVVMQSSYVSKNGEEPSGEISVTQYSSDPRDLGPSEDLEHKHGILSKTITKKFGKHDTTSKSITDKKYASNNEERKTTSTSTKKVSRRGSVKEMSQKFLDNAVETIKNERNSSYPKAGLILRSSSFKDTSSGTSREGSPEDGNEIRRNVKVTSKSSTETNTFLTNSSKVANVQDVISRMKNEDVREGESLEDTEARSMLNKFLGAQVILSGMETHVTSPKKSGSNKLEMTASTSSSQKRTTKITTTITENGIPKTITRVFTHPITVDDLANIWDEETLRFLLEQSTEYEERRIIRGRIKEIMAANEACADYVDKTIEECQTGDVQETVETSKETFSEGPFTRTEVTTTRVSSQQISKKPMSPFAKFRQLDKQNSLNTPPSTPNTPTSGGPMFKFTDPNLSRSASTIKERLLQWCQMKTKEYENIKLDNFSTSWADGLAFCALIHHFLPDAFDYHQLTPNNRRHNFTLAFKIADEKADIFPLLDVDDMVATRRPDWKCVFTYVQAIYRRFKDED